MAKNNKSYTIALALLVCSVILIVVGYFLFTILIPLQDFDTYTRQELLELQKELAINYPLGKAMMIAGGIGLVIDLLVYINWRILRALPK